MFRSYWPKCTVASHSITIWPTGIIYFTWLKGEIWNQPTKFDCSSTCGLWQRRKCYKAENNKKKTDRHERISAPQWNYLQSDQSAKQRVSPYLLLEPAASCTGNQQPWRNKAPRPSGCWRCPRCAPLLLECRGLSPAGLSASPPRGQQRLVCDPALPPPEPHHGGLW